MIGAAYLAIFCLVLLGGIYAAGLDAGEGGNACGDIVCGAVIAGLLWPAIIAFLAIWCVLGVPFVAGQRAAKRVPKARSLR